MNTKLITTDPKNPMIS